MAYRVVADCCCGSADGIRWQEIRFSSLFIIKLLFSCRRRYTSGVWQCRWRLVQHDLSVVVLEVAVQFRFGSWAADAAARLANRTSRFPKIRRDECLDTSCCRRMTPSWYLGMMSVVVYCTVRSPIWPVGSSYRRGCGVPTSVGGIRKSRNVARLCFGPLSGATTQIEKQ